MIEAEQYVGAYTAPNTTQTELARPSFQSSSRSWITERQRKAREQGPGVGLFAGRGGEEEHRTERSERLGCTQGRLPMRTVKAGAPSELERRWRGLTSSGPLQVPERRWRDARRSTAASGGVACIDGIDITFGAVFRLCFPCVVREASRPYLDLRRNVRSDPRAKMRKEATRV